jgi:hypothetical protein
MEHECDMQGRSSVLHAGSDTKHIVDSIDSAHRRQPDSIKLGIQLCPGFACLYRDIDEPTIFSFAKTCLPAVQSCQSIDSPLQAGTMGSKSVVVGVLLGGCWVPFRDKAATLGVASLKRPTRAAPAS